LFRDKVLIKDVEEKEVGSTNAVGRPFVLPLPRTFEEAADWGARFCKRGSRVYAMYPQTTSLYSGTVIDHTTYCRGDDDILVVEFDGEEHDASGSVQHYHIPARFVTLIPKEFPASKPQATSSLVARKKVSQLQGQLLAKNNNNNKRTTTTNKAPPSSQQQQHKRAGSSDSALNDMLDQMYDDHDANTNNKHPRKEQEPPHPADELDLFMDFD